MLGPAPRSSSGTGPAGPRTQPRPLQHEAEEGIGRRSVPANAKAQAHHIAPGGNILILNRLKQFDIGIDSVENGVYVASQRVNGWQGALHRGRHTNAYEAYIFEGLMEANTRRQALQFLESVRDDLLSGQLALNAAR